MLKPLDIVLLTSLLTFEPSERATFALIAQHLETSPPSVTRALNRLVEARLLRKQRSGAPGPDDYVVDRGGTLEVLTHALRHFMPTTPGPNHRGVPTAHAGPDLAQRIRASEPYVWPHLDGESHGPTIEPLIPSVARIALSQHQFYRMMALTEACRVGRVRERTLAADLLREILFEREPWKTP